MDTRSSLLLVLCHDPGWDRLYQACSAAATAAAAGREVVLVFYFQALAKLVEGRLDEFSLHPRDPEAEARLEERVLEIGTRPPSALLEAARETGRVKLLACSASVHLVGLENEEVRRHVDEIIGWPTVMNLMGPSAQVLYL